MRRQVRAAQNTIRNGKAAERNGAPAMQSGDAAPIWDLLAKLGASIPPDELEKLPTDLARNVDHYLYGAPKRG